MYHFCTYFDRNYLTRGLALYDSLTDNCRRPFILWVLCFDSETFDILARLSLPNMRLISQQDFERDDAGLASAKMNRSPVEYYWTCTPSLMLYVFNISPEIEVITYLDADLFFYGDPQTIYEEFKDGSILITEHRYAPEHMHFKDTSGIYNVSVMAFRRDERGLACLRWWRERCLEWCYARAEDGKFGDQKYLDDWPTRFPGVVVLQHKGAGLAPWNIEKYAITKRASQVWVDDEFLIFYHFHGFKQHSPFAYTAATFSFYDLTALNKQRIYEPYVSALNSARSFIKRVYPNHETAFDDPAHSTLRNILEGRVDLVGATRWLPLVRKVYRTVQRLYRAVRYRQPAARTSF